MKPKKDTKQPKKVKLQVKSLRPLSQETLRSVLGGAWGRY